MVWTFKTYQGERKKKNPPHKKSIFNLLPILVEFFTVVWSQIITTVLFQQYTLSLVSTYCDAQYIRFVIFVVVVTLWYTKEIDSCKYDVLHASNYINFIFFFFLFRCITFNVCIRLAFLTTQLIYAEVYMYYKL